MTTQVRRLLADERVRFLLVGGVNTAVGYGLFVVIELSIGRWIGYLGSLYLSYALAVTLAFVLHRRLTFRAHTTGGSALVDFARFCSVYVVALAVNTIGLPLLVEVGHLPPIGAQAIMVVATTLISYLGHKYFSFRRAAPDDHPEEATKTIPSPEIVSDDSSAT
ncbi:MAG: GtrA family protein [Pseudolysinimonas sp.]